MFFKSASEAKGYENGIREIPLALRKTSMKKRYKKFNGGNINFIFFFNIIFFRKTQKM